MKTTCIRFTLMFADVKVRPALVFALSLMSVIRVSVVSTKGATCDLTACLSR